MKTPFPAEIIRRAVRVQGVVQGVGFRPFVYRIARENRLTGTIGNDTDGVTIEVEGSLACVELFLHQLRTMAPPMARIDAVSVAEMQPTGDAEFSILSSQVLGQVSTGIPPDTATCFDCLRELLDPDDRRYRYPFLNCTNCGPRYTITRRIPYDRPYTSMAAFPMCFACQAEYDDPRNRRFHAQPNACRDCGPRVWLASADGTEMVSGDPIADSIERLLQGEILAVKGIGGFHLCVNALDDSAVMRLRNRKNRHQKPLAVMVRDLAAVRVLCMLTPEDEALLSSPARPIVLLHSRSDTALCASVAPGVPWLGIFLPYAPLQHLLFADSRIHALVMTSANLSEEPIAIDNDEARARLAGIADAFLMHDREILQRCDDSVTAVVLGAPQLIRRARGYVPLGVKLPAVARPVLAVGGHLKSVFALADGRFAHQSQHLGDLESLAGIEFFEESLAHLMRTFEIEPQAVIHDLHPGYLSTAWARQWATQRKLPLVAVQHHHAHIAACMGEHGIQERVIGIALDGTGYGTDGKIWGGEVLLCAPQKFERFAHLDYVFMPGGDAAVREPWRMALAHLSASGVDVCAPEMLKLLGVAETDARLMLRMIERGINAPMTSSTGRLFDAAAALILGRGKVAYEAQAAVELEGIAIDQSDDVASYQIDVIENSSSQSIDGVRIATGSIWLELLRDISHGVAQAKMSARFHAALADAFTRAAGIARQRTQINTVALSGGVFHNRRLSRLLHQRLTDLEFNVLVHHNVSPGDGGLSYGQVVAGSAKLNAS